MNLNTKWPKVPPPLSEAQKEAREKYMMLWHQELPNKYQAVENFNHGFSAKLDVTPGSRTLEVGAGLGEHAAFENLKIQDYVFLEYREEFCNEIKKRFPKHEVLCGDIQSRLAFSDHSFDRIIAIHVLEHLVNLPKALQEIDRLLKPNGVFDIVIPCEGGLAHSLGRKVTAERLFKKNFKMDFKPICKNEHVSTFREIFEEMNQFFSIEKSSYFPSLVPVHHLNFVAGFRLRKKLLA